MSAVSWDGFGWTEKDRERFGDEAARVWFAWCDGGAREIPTYAHADVDLTGWRPLMVAGGRAFVESFKEGVSGGIANDEVTAYGQTARAPYSTAPAKIELVPMVLPHHRRRSWPVERLAPDVSPWNFTNRFVQLLLDLPGEAPSPPLRFWFPRARTEDMQTWDLQNDQDGCRVRMMWPPEAMQESVDGMRADGY